MTAEKRNEQYPSAPPVKFKPTEQETKARDQWAKGRSERFYSLKQK